MILLESIIDGIRDIKDHLGRTMLQLVGIILGAGSIVATFSLSVAGKAASMEYYRVSGGIQKIWIWDKPTGKVTLDAKALASKGLTFRDAMAIKNNAKEIDLVSPVSNETMTVRYREIEKPWSIMGVVPAYSRMNDVKNHEEAVDQIRKVLHREHGVKDYEVMSRVANLKRNEDNNRMYDMTFMICGIISLLVGGIVVMNIQLASFNERVREVGTRKAVGASPSQIFGQFLAESILVSLLGGFLGLFVGKLFTDGIAALTRDPAMITPDTIVKALIFAAGTGLIFGMYPAIRASRLNPIEALRTE